MIVLLVAVAALGFVAGLLVALLLVRAEAHTDRRPGFVHNHATEAEIRSVELELERRRL